MNQIAVKIRQFVRDARGLTTVEDQRLLSIADEAGQHDLTPTLLLQQQKMVKLEVALRGTQHVLAKVICAAILTEVRCNARLAQMEADLKEGGIGDSDTDLSNIMLLVQEFRTDPEDCTLKAVDNLLQKYAEANAEIANLRLAVKLGRP